MKKNSFLNLSLRLLHNGIVSIPVIGKKPLVKWSVYQVDTPKISVVKSWPWGRTTGLAVICRKDLIGLDFDDPDAFVSVKHLLPANAHIEKTPKGGKHVLLRMHNPPKSGAYGLCEVKSHGILINLYKPDSETLFNLPYVKDITFLTGKTATISKKKNSVFDALDGTVLPGKRNNAFTQLAGFLRSKGLPGDLIEKILRAANIANEIGLPDAEIKSISESVARYKTDIFPRNEVFIPNIHNKPEYVKPVLTLCGERILSTGNFSALIALPGVGKTSVCGSICAKSLNPECDGLGYSLMKNCRVCFLDTEQARADNWGLWYSVRLRAKVSKNQKISLGFILLEMSDYKARQDFLFRLFESKKYDLFLIDGIADFVPDVNDSESCNAFLDSFRMYLKKFNVAAFVTIHSNPQRGSEKARGHLGSEVMRRAESVLKIDRNSSLRKITMDFNYGKNRKGADRLEQFFTWDEDNALFISCDANLAHKRPSTVKRYSHIVNELKKIKRVWKFTELIQESIRIDGNKGNLNIGNKIYKWLLINGFIEKNKEGLWEICD